MQLDLRSFGAHRWRAARSVAACTLAAYLVGCAALGTPRRDPAPEPRVDRTSAEGTVVSGYLETLLRLSQGSAAQQAEVMTALKNDYAAAPTPSRVLRYALGLATPGHTGFDPVGAQRLLREVLANPETLLPAERAMAHLQLAMVDRHEALTADAKRAQNESDRSDRERISSLQRRLAAENEENARLKRALDEAQAKLDAIAKIEQGMKNRTPQPEGRNP
jgi:hypothetical protein